MKIIQNITRSELVVIISSVLAAAISIGMLIWGFGDLIF